MQLFKQGIGWAEHIINLADSHPCGTLIHQIGADIEQGTHRTLHDEMLVILQGHQGGAKTT